MAFGLGFNKAKVLSTAEKFVAQNKIPAAIEEYRKVLQHDKKDLTILNTVADLCVRAGKTEEAIKRFYELAEDCVEAGLIPRAIATYRRIAKIAPDAVQAMMRLGDLYSMQGLLRDARVNYLQAVEFYTQSREKEKARDVFEKILMLDMENPQLQARMAGLYAETGKQDEAISTYLGAIERFLDRGRPAEASAALQSLLQLDPQHPEGRTLLGRSQLEQGQLDQAIATLQAIPFLASHKGALNLLFQAFATLGDAAKTREIANQLFEAHDDFSGLAQIATDLVTRGELNEAVNLYQAASEKLLAENSSGSLIQGLKSVLAADRSHNGALELMLQAYQAAGNAGDVRETMERLAQAYRTQGEMEKARELYKELISLEPDNTDHVHLLRQVEAQMGIGEVGPPTEPEPAPAMVSELSGPLADLSAPPADEAPKQETLRPREEETVSQCITEAELYITYKQFRRAIQTVERGLAEIPGNIQLMEQLLALCELARDYGKAADCCEALTEAYIKLGDGDRASRYGELIVSYRQKAETGGSAAAGAPDTTAFPTSEEPALPEEEASAFPDASSAEAPPEVQEVDLSMEWASVSGAEESASATTDDASLVEEIEFYTQAGLVSDAAAALARLEEHFPSHPAIAGFRERLGLTTAPSSDAPADASVTVPQNGEWTMGGQAEPVPPAFELSLEEVEVQPAAATPSGPEKSRSADPFASLAGDLEEAFTPPSHPEPMPAMTSPAAAPGDAAADSFQDLFAEFKAEMEEPAAASDVETHYNMGVAFKEMALYDEAIGEFQKAHQLAGKLNDYSNVVQCCSLLATCFLEKGLPQLAVKWYQTALDAPGVDAESVVALLYELGSAYELAGDREAALRRFLEVYARNIDYRDVATRIHSLQQPQ